MRWLETSLKYKSQGVAINGGMYLQNATSKIARGWAISSKIGVKRHHILLKADFEYVLVFLTAIAPLYTLT